jgi:hypothetical protein
MIEVIPNLHVAAGKLAKIAMEQYYAFVSIIHGRLTSPTGIPSAKNTIDIVRRRLAVSRRAKSVRRLPKST